jgi:hypothetical protein
LVASELPKGFGCGRETAPDVENGSNQCGAFSVQIFQVHKDLGLLVERLGVGAVTGPTLRTLFKSSSQKMRKVLFGRRKAMRRDSKWPEMVIS